MGGRQAGNQKGEGRRNMAYSILRYGIDGMTSDDGNDISYT